MSDRHDVEFWWVTRNGELTLAEVYILNGLPIEAFIAGIDGPSNIALSDMVSRIEKPCRKEAAP